MSAVTRHTRGALAIPRSRGVVTGLIILILGIWGGIIPFVGPYFGYEFGSGGAFHFTLQRLWLDILPGIAAIVGGAMLIASGNRPGAALGGWLALIGGIWFVIGVPLSLLWHSSAALGITAAGIGPAKGGHVLQGLEYLGYFFGLGALITALSSFALGRLAVRSVRDVHTAEKRRGDRHAGPVDDDRSERRAAVPASEADVPRDRR